MTPVARIFDEGDQARDAARKLEAAGYEVSRTFVLAPAPAPDTAPAEEETDANAAPAVASGTVMSAEELVEQVGPAGELSITRAILCVRALENGKAVVIVGAPYGYVVLANSIMDGCGAAPADIMDTARPDNPSPFSDFIGMPCLENRLSFLSGERPLLDSGWTLFPLKLRNKLTFDVKLIDNPAWLSSKLGLKTLKTDKPRTFNVKLVDNPAWLSSKLGLKTLSRDKPLRTRFGFSLLTNQQD